MLREVAALRRQVAAWRHAGETIGIVPTMGALHEGHLSLVRAARQHCRHIVATLFVNPLQFNATDDFKSYPRDEEADRRMFASAGVDLLFAPPVGEVYPAGFDTSVTVGALSRPLCGATRPGHFQGVATVVSKLLMITQPDRGYFGEKDYQQLLVIKRMNADLGLPIEILGVPTVREKDGLALSSRNAYLSEAERGTAPTLHRVLKETAASIRKGAPVGPTLVRGRRTIKAAGFKLDYLEARHAKTLAQVTSRKDGPIRLLVAARIGGTRLIDNLAV